MRVSRDTLEENGLRLAVRKGERVVVDRLAGIDVEEEHAKIQRKESKLPARMREMVEKRHARIQAAKEAADAAERNKDVQG